MSQLIIRAGDFIVNARLDYARATKTCAAFKKAMPSGSEAIHVEIA
jgi:hypothetical protein